MPETVTSDKANAEEFLFASRDPISRKVGSLYFTWGRLRLCHGHGPTLSVHSDKCRYIVPRNGGYYGALEDLDGDARKAFMANKVSAKEIIIIPNTHAGVDAALCKMHTEWQDYRNSAQVFELLDGSRHPSRGYPSVIKNFTDDDLEYIFDSVKNNIPNDKKDAGQVRICNDALTEAIAGKPGLIAKLNF